MKYTIKVYYLNNLIFEYTTKNSHIARKIYHKKVIKYNNDDRFEIYMKGSI